MTYKRPILGSITEADKERLSALKVPIPKRESDRLLVLRQCNLLDTQADESYDRFSSLCARVFKVPVVLISLLDADRQWFKSKVGTDVTQTSRDIAFCAYTILEETPRVMVVPDAQEDIRFQNNPLVVGPPYIRFYGGASIIIQGIKVGTVCLMDQQPRSDFSQTQESILIDIADSVAAMMEDRRNMVVDAQLNGVHMHQSLLSVLSQPLRDLNTAHEHIADIWSSLATHYHQPAVPSTTAAVANTMRTSDISTNKYVHVPISSSNSDKTTDTTSLNNGNNGKSNTFTAIKGMQDHVAHFQQLTEHFTQLLDTMLRCVTRVVIHPETLAEFSSNNNNNNNNNNHHMLNPHQHNNNSPESSFLLPLQPVSWLEGISELLQFYRQNAAFYHPSTYTTNNTIKNHSNSNSSYKTLAIPCQTNIFAYQRPLYTHPDVLYVSLAAIFHQVYHHHNNNRNNQQMLHISHVQCMQEELCSSLTVTLQLEFTNHDNNTNDNNDDTNSMNITALDEARASWQRYETTVLLGAVGTLLSWVNGRISSSFANNNNYNNNSQTMHPACFTISLTVPSTPDRKRELLLHSSVQRTAFVGLTDIVDLGHFSARQFQKINTLTNTTTTTTTTTALHFTTNTNNRNNHSNMNNNHTNHHTNANAIANTTNIHHHVPASLFLTQKSSPTLLPSDSNTNILHNNHSTNDHFNANDHNDHNAAAHHHNHHSKFSSSLSTAKTPRKTLLVISQVAHALWSHCVHITTNITATSTITSNSNGTNTNNHSDNTANNSTENSANEHNNHHGSNTNNGNYNYFHKSKKVVPTDADNIADEHSVHNSIDTNVDTNMNVHTNNPTMNNKHVKYNAVVPV